MQESVWALIGLVKKSEPSSKQNPKKLIIFEEVIRIWPEFTCLKVLEIKHWPFLSKSLWKSFESGQNLPVSRFWKLIFGNPKIMRARLRAWHFESFFIQALKLWMGSYKNLWKFCRSPANQPALIIKLSLNTT